MKWTAHSKKNSSTISEVEGRLDRVELELGERYDSRDRFALPGIKVTDKSPKSCHKPSCMPILVMIIVVMFVVLLPQLGSLNGVSNLELVRKKTANITECQKTCKISLVESIPEGVVFPNTTVHASTFHSWERLIKLANKTIDIASFYWTLTGNDVVPDPTDWEGEKILEDLKKAGLNGINIRIAQNKPSESEPDADTCLLAKLGVAEVRSMDFNRLIGAGILHTKLWIVDKQHFYVGSANMDWRSLTQVKELGVAIYDCPCLAEDVSKIFDVYWSLGGENATLPQHWPAELSTEFNHTNPMNISFNGTSALTYVASSPPQFCPDGRSKDLDAILDTMKKAKSFINIAVMDYIPAMLYTEHHQYWSTIDNVLRQLAIDKGIQIRILVSHWDHSPKAMGPFLKSLQDISNVYPHVYVEVKSFVVPVLTPGQGKIPFSRVNHNKYMVTDNAVYIGTSNWSGDYFINTGGVGIVVFKGEGLNATSLWSQTAQVFERDWNSQYSMHFI